MYKKTIKIITQISTNLCINMFIYNNIIQGRNVGGFSYKLTIYMLINSHKQAHVFCLANYCEKLIT